MKATNTAWNHIRRSPYQALAAIFIMMQTFFVISIFTFVVVGSLRTIDYFESIPKVTAFFKTEAQQKDIDEVKSQLEATGKIESIKFVSKEEALAIYKEQNKDDDPLLLELVTADILPSSLEISTVQLNDLGEISQIVQKSPHVERVIFQKDLTANLQNWTNALKKIGGVFIVVLALDSIFLMAIIIGIKISHKREEIEIMKLLSATNWYVRWPFIWEGIFYGVTGAIIGWIFASGTLLYATPFLQSFLGNVSLLPVSPLFLLVLLGAELLFAVLLGAFASFLAVLRYLK
jgi:cell division transport system permease protein